MRGKLGGSGMSFELVRLDELALGVNAGLVDGPFGSNLPASDYRSDGVPVIRGNNLSKGEHRFKAQTFLSCQPRRQIGLSVVVVFPTTSFSLRRERSGR